MKHLNTHNRFNGHTHIDETSGGSREAGGTMAPPVGGLKNFFRQYINIITKPTAYDGPWEY